MYEGIFYPFGSNWYKSGGNETKYSYYGGKPFELNTNEKDILLYNGDKLMEEHAKKIIKLPLYLKFDDEIDGKKLLVTHAPSAEFLDDYLKLHGGTDEENELAMEKYEDKFGLIARCNITKNGDLINRNRHLPTKETKYFNVTGHNITGILIIKFGDIDWYNPKTEVIIGITLKQK